jgi:hypothetical protein
MRLKQHINETIDFDNINVLIHKNCKQYLKLIGHHKPLFRGMESEPYIGIKDVRKDRKPYGMSSEEADYLNAWLQKNGHARRDQSVICTSDGDHVDIFGEPYYIFPLDHIAKYTWFHSPDMNMEGDAGWDYNTIMAWKLTTNGEYIVNSNILDRLKMPFEDFFTTNKEFNYAYDHGYEMWIDCDKYYYVMAGGWCKWDVVKQMVVK